MSPRHNQSPDAIVRDIKRKTRRKFSSEEKIRIVLEGLKGEFSISELCRREGIAANLWIRFFLEAIQIQTENTLVQVVKIEKLYQELKEKMPELNSIYANSFLDALFIKPRFTAKSIRELTGVANTQTLYNLIDKFIEFDKLKIISLIQEFDKTIHFSRTNKIINKDSGSDAEFMFDIEVAVAKKMSNDISRKAKMGLVEKAEQGKCPSTAPLGYINNKETHLIDIDSERSSFVKTAFVDMVSGNYSLNTLVEKLYRDGLRSRKGLKVTKPTLAHLLKNPFYYGCFLFVGQLWNGIHEPIITKQQFDMAQNILSGKGHSYKVNKIGFAFNNLIKCGECGCKVLGELKKKKYTYYHCTFSKGRHVGENAYLKEDKMAMLFEDSVRKVSLLNEKVAWAKNALKESKID